MFTNLLPASSIPFNVLYSDYACSHYRKSFEKKYKGIQWEKTEKSFFEDLRRLRMPDNTTQKTMQVDQLKYFGNHWLFKYDFRIAGTKESTKSSGNRIIAYIDNNTNKLNILLIYAKTDLPQNESETSFIINTIKNQYPEIWRIFK